MSSMTYRTSRPDRWTSPRPYSDASLRRLIHGPIQPMEQPTLLQRLLGMR